MATDRHETRRPNPVSVPLSEPSPRPGPTQRRGLVRTVLVMLALTGITLFVYAQLRHHAFLGFDDPEYVTDNPPVLAGLTWHGGVWAFTSGRAGNWHPITWLSHMLDVQAYGAHAGPHHLTSLVFHLANTLLLFALFLRMTGFVHRSAVVAALFAIHPLHVESVAWVAERKDVLSTLLWLATMWAYVSYVRVPRASRYLVVVLTFAVGLMAKPMLVTLPFVLLLVDLWPLERVALGVEARSAWRRLIREKLPLIALAGVSSVVTFVVQRREGAVVELEAIPWGLRVANSAVSYVAYLSKMVWPAHLAAYYPYPKSLPPWQVLGAVVLLTGVTLVVTRQARRRPYLLVGWLWFLVTLVPVIGLVQVGLQSMADRYTYVPLVGIFLLVVWGTVDVLGSWKYGRWALALAGTLVILAYAAAANTQAAYWRDGVALWTRTLELTTDNYLAENNLGFELKNAGRIDEAIGHYRQALRIKPNVAITRNNLGIALVDRGNVDEAIVQFAESLRIAPSERAQNNLGIALAQQERLDESVAHFNEAIRLKPDFAEPYNNLGVVLGRKGDIVQAAAEFAEAVRLRPTYGDAHINLALALKAQGRTGDAVQHVRTALELASSDPVSRRKLDELMKTGLLPAVEAAR